MAERYLLRQLIMSKNKSLQTREIDLQRREIFRSLIQEALELKVRTYEDARVFYVFFVESGLQVSKRFRDNLVRDLAGGVRSIRWEGEPPPEVAVATEAIQEIQAKLLTDSAVPKNVRLLRLERDLEASRASLLNRSQSDTGWTSMKILLFFLSLLLAYVSYMRSPSSPLLLAQYAEPPGSTIIL